jgi:Flp pilus assembly CpaE family ATPase
MESFIISDSDELAERLTKSLYDQGIASAKLVRYDAVNEPAKSSSADLIFFAIPALKAEHLDFLKSLRAHATASTRIIVVSHTLDNGTVLKSIRCGAADFLSADATMEGELIELITRIRADHRQECTNGRLATIIPCHGPFDANLLSVNLAAAVARLKGPCGLLDFHFRGGDLALLLKLEPKHTLVDLVRQRDLVDDAMFRQALTVHPSGVNLLAGPTEFGALREMSLQGCQHIIDIARHTWPFTIVNTEDIQHAEQVRALAASDTIILTMRLDVVSVRRTKQHIDFLLHNRIPREHIHVVAMDVGQPGELPQSAVAKILGQGTIYAVPADSSATLMSVNVGAPFVEEQPSARISQAVRRLAALVVGDESCVAAPQHNPISVVKTAAMVAVGTLPFCK